MRCCSFRPWFHGRQHNQKILCRNNFRDLNQQVLSVDGSEIWRNNHLESKKHPVNNRGSTTNLNWWVETGCQPSTVWELLKKRSCHFQSSAVFSDIWLHSLGLQFFSESGGWMTDKVAFWSNMKQWPFHIFLYRFKTALFPGVSLCRNSSVQY